MSASTTAKTAEQAAAALVPSGPVVVLSETELIEQNMPLVGHLVREAMNRLPAHVNRDDLVSAGMTALVLSARSFEEGRGVPFARFAAIRIRGALLDELRSMDWASRSVRGRARELENVRTELISKLGRSPKPEELANAMGLSVSELGSIDADVQRASVLSLQGFAPETGAALLPDNQRGPEQLLVDREQLGFLHDAIEELPERLRYVVRCYFFEQRQMSDIATELGVTESRISQLRAEALKLLKHGLKAQYEPAAETEQSRSTAKLASYAAAVANRSSLSARLQMTNAMGETVAAAYEPEYRYGMGTASIA
ncbi:sigma-70 family RNA polymerase sigma factor [Jatrophihabitans telluris]|uniref:Sigma-70 family RNA polymerase sigma factor n=1 Tax=Jatrophihabitans telluris TaxID=2038343 RepID=A0ABY4QWP6_9ACTN|nr:sigma-70 family RNA polymerase sigma factor [Jatrophihabitans telluris]UQX87940.1 sigma-70 family RNA polymerase sigma factor [Jatrophihabitans telluris]